MSPPSHRTKGALGGNLRKEDESAGDKAGDFLLFFFSLIKMDKCLLTLAVGLLTLGKKRFLAAES